MGVAVRALEFGCSHIADMRFVEPHRMDNHYLLCCSCCRIICPFANIVNL